jgi:hypothetical protein
VLKKKIWANFQRNIELFTKKIVKKLLKIWSWDPGSEIRDPEKTYSGSRIRIRNTAGTGTYVNKNNRSKRWYRICLRTEAMIVRQVLA